MTVQIYKPVQRSARSVPSAAPVRSSTWTKPPARAALDLPPLREVRHSYRPRQPRLDLILGIEAMTHPETPSFAELESIVSEEEHAL